MNAIRVFLPTASGWHMFQTSLAATKFTFRPSPREVRSYRLPRAVETSRYGRVMDTSFSFEPAGRFRRFLFGRARHHRLGLSPLCSPIATRILRLDATLDTMCFLMAGL